MLDKDKEQKTYNIDDTRKLIIRSIPVNKTFMGWIISVSRYKKMDNVWRYDGCFVRSVKKIMPRQSAINIVLANLGTKV